MNNQAISKSTTRRLFPLHGWIGLGLMALFWALNWSLDGLRTHWIFFPLWLGYCLTMDALVFARKGTSLLTRSWERYVGLFLVSAPVWWIFEILNWRLGNWYYEGSENFTPFQFWFWATLNFTTVIPAVFGSAELVSTFEFLKRLQRGPQVQPDRLTVVYFLIVGLVMLGMLVTWPRVFFPFVWLSLFFILEPINVWRGNRSLTEYTRIGDWRPILVLWIGVLITAFFWEMWNYLSFPKWTYHVPWGGCCKIFEMPLLGYGGYLPFALEIYAMYHFVAGIFGDRRTTYIQTIEG